MSWTTTEAEQALIAFVTGSLVDPDDDLTIGPEDDLLTSGLVDSLGIMRLVAFIESELGVQVPAADLTIDNFVSVRAISGYLSQLGGQAGEGTGGP